MPLQELQEISKDHLGKYAIPFMGHPLLIAKKEMDLVSRTFAKFLNSGIRMLMKISHRTSNQPKKLQ
jgi:hypothetical protein